MNGLFQELIRVAIGTQESLFRLPSETEWCELFELAVKQSLVGICFVGLNRLGADSDDGFAKIGMSEDLFFNWMGMAAQINMKNEKLNKQCQQVQQLFLSDGLETCVLKGQGVACYYNETIRTFRQSGDIDIWVNGTWHDVMDYVNARTPNREFDMKHTHLEAFDDTIVEVHWWPSVPVNPLYSKPLREYYHAQAPLQCKHEIALPDGIGKITAPEAKFESVHVMCHIFNHFLYEGIGLRQMMDLYFVLVNGEMTDSDRYEVSETIDKIGLHRFAPAAMWVLEKIFGMKHEFAFCAIDEKLGQVLLSEIEEGGNFGHDSQENKVANETFYKRMLRRLKRRIRLVNYNPIGLLCAPFTKVRIMLWKHRQIKKYKL